MDQTTTQLFAKVRCLITDLDGVLTSGQLNFDNQGNEIKSFHVHDGMGLKLLLNADIEVGVITTSRNPVVDLRMEQLNIQHYYKGQLNKAQAYQSIKQKLNLEDVDIAYIGDDLPDLTILSQVGFPIAVKNALPEVKEIAKYVTKLSGGLGAVREVCDLILESQQLKSRALNSYLNG